VSEFESKLEAYLDVEYARVVNSGTTALVAALEGCGIGDGDEVIVPSFTFIATANAVRMVSAEPVFTDIETHTYGLDPAAVERNVGPDTAAILPVHPYGTACAIDELAAIAEREDLFLIEDAAEVFGAEYDGKPLGTVGDCGALSFCQNKVFSTGEGGAVITDSDEIAMAVEKYRSHGRVSDEYFQTPETGTYETVGTNVRMSDLTAALGCSQIEKVDEFIQDRRSVAAGYNEGFGEIAGVTPHRTLDGATHVYQLYTIELAPDVERETVIDHLQERDIGVKVYWDPPVHRTAAHEDVLDPDRELPKTDRVASRVLSLPIHPNLTDREIERVVQAVQDGLKVAT